ncbi:imidazole glycerol phosphate synthase subunit HisH [Flavobacteriaceae bacterium]|nr:imidazole glycerol phosphate synthase subunit HisH [Flavobacteriaceae bacterium]
MIGLINYGSGNIAAIANIFEKENIQHMVINKPSELNKVKKIILPGVSAFDRTMELLEEKNFISELHNLVAKKRIPIMGICVGMQVLFEKSDEGSKSGFGWINGNVIKLSNTKTPHMGWNSITKVDHRITKGIDFEEGFYFLHSYKCIPSEKNIISIFSDYDEAISAIVIKDNIIGIQFHPEKSHSNGVQIFRNFYNL